MSLAYNWSAPGKMLTWDEIRSRRTPCTRCRSTIPIAGPLSFACRERVAAALRSGRDLEVFRLIREDTGSSLTEAKGTYQHLVRKIGQCHWCHVPLPVAELVDCPGCQALNIAM
jgi:hypothetical protein